jgi:uncharacterized membrane protein
VSASNQDGRKGIEATIALAALGGALVAQRDRRRLGAIAALVGLGFIAHAARPILRDWLLRRGTARRRVRLATTIEVARPVAAVFAFCKDFENFPRVIGSLRRVTDFQDGRSHWEAYTASGHVLEWDALVTKYVPNTVIGWASTSSSSVEMTGILRFAATPNNGTRVTIELTYAPREGGLGDALHALASRPRQAQILAEIERAGFYIESLPARPTRDSAA